MVLIAYVCPIKNRDINTWKQYLFILTNSETYWPSQRVYNKLIPYWLQFDRQRNKDSIVKRRLLSTFSEITSAEVPEFNRKWGLLNPEFVEQPVEVEIREVEASGRRWKCWYAGLVCMPVHYYVLILYREGTNVRTYVKFLAPTA